MIRRLLLRAPRLFVRFFSPDDRELGELGEEVAARHLARRGWTILARRLRTRSGEADIVARSRDDLAVVEVKTGRASPVPRPRGVELQESVSLRWRPGARCDGRRLARLRAVGKEVAGSREFRAQAVRDGFRPRVDLIEVWLAQPGKTFRVVHHEDLRRPLP